MPTPRVAGRLGYLLKHAQMQYAELTTEAMRPHGITGRQCAVLTAIDDQEPQSQQEVARRLDLDRTTMVALIDELEAKGLVSRSPAPDDRRKNVVALTALGRGTLTAALAATTEAENTFLAPLSRSDAEAFRRLLAAVVRT
ncbi:MarR family winged helix-turn-helix transcriptional regulator [Paractinoplanes durhamensis]|uniref:MarR family transcriptional regulator n=1 Tax=Paractinoplanes durhamensis TaxID=113563 RepID=A0ABQ3YXU8_9ACTN|nr:MarR family transcriptional regulator [Actinoplanes durhamensis]GIE02401.1 MarR family transcriptional regulator [Actinoplanes durhamensis]